MDTDATLAVRPRRVSDLAQLGHVLRRVHQVDGYPVEGVADPQAWLQPAGEIAAWTAVVAAQAVGHVSLTVASTEDEAVQIWVSRSGGAFDDVAVVARLFVDPEYRRRKAGRELMRAAYEHDTALRKRLVFDVMLKDRQAIRLYEALGCQRLGLITHQHSGGLEEPAAVYVAPEQVSLAGS